MERDPLNVFTCFKRKMGTSETYTIDRLKKEVGPVALSAQVLKELMNFVHTGETVHAAVITIPSSFDTLQSNATKTAGIQAGLKEVYLLQEPIAASLAFVNENKEKLVEEKKWLVYDFGGGTFDVALLSLSEREMKVLDNAGDNFLGGMDFDNRIVAHRIVPFLENAWKEEKLWEKFTTKGHPYQKLYYELLFKAEEAKKELSRFPETEIDIDFSEKDYFATIPLSRKDFNQLIKMSVDRTISLAKTVLERNGCLATDIEKIALVGGSTLIPYVREELRDHLGIPLDSSIAPTAAVGIGAAYYAATKTLKTPMEDLDGEPHVSGEAPETQLYYQKNSKDAEELISIKGQLPQPHAFYRIQRADGGFDSGMVKAQGISTFLWIYWKVKKTPSHCASMMPGKMRFSRRTTSPLCKGTMMYRVNYCRRIFASK